mgnify:CR=1 FL=1|jgi:hypothetical protein
MLVGAGNGANLRRVILDTLPFLPHSVVDSIMNTLRRELIVADSSKCELQGQTDTVETHGTAKIPHMLHTYTNATMRLEDTLVERMNMLTPTEFERILHPIFEEDELTLIIAGNLVFIDDCEIFL